LAYGQGQSIQSDVHLVHLRLVGLSIANRCSALSQLQLSFSGLQSTPTTSVQKGTCYGLMLDQSNGVRLGLTAACSVFIIASGFQN